MKKSPRSSNIQTEYEKWQRENAGKPCTFCNLPNKQIIKEYDNFIIAKNRFPYEDWFGHKVVNHVMLISKRHVEYFSEFTNKEIEEYMQIISEYDKNGNSSHTKNKFDPGRSITHFHTHLFKVVE